MHFVMEGRASQLEDRDLLRGSVNFDSCPTPPANLRLPKDQASSAASQDLLTCCYLFYLEYTATSFPLSHPLLFTWTTTSYSSNLSISKICLHSPRLDQDSTPTPAYCMRPQHMDIQLFD